MEKTTVKATITKTETNTNNDLMIYCDISTTGYIASPQVCEYIRNSKYSVIGNMYEMTISEDMIFFIKYISGNLETIKTKLIENSQKKQIVTLAMLLDCAHKRGDLKSIMTELVSEKDNFVTFKATVNDKYVSYGFASSENVQGEKVKSLHAVAETRAIVRALKLFTNYGEKVENEE